MKAKIYLGPKVRRLREQRGLTLDACARELGLSGSYLSQIETNQRPVTARVLIALARVFELDPGEFDTDDESRLIADLREATADVGLGLPVPELPELKLAATTTPALAHQFLALHRAFRGLDERLRRLDETVGIRSADGPRALTPYQEVRDFFHYRDNYVDALDVAAEDLATAIGVRAETRPVASLEAALLARFGVRVVRAALEPGVLRRYDPATRVVALERNLPEPTRAFQLATQLVELALAGEIEASLASGELESAAAHSVARVGLANYAAGALLMPYRDFLAAAGELRHDVEQLQRRYGTSFEQVCHRLSTLQRPGARGVPFYFVRVDQAGNITKRHSSTRFQFARFGGACPLWNVHEAFSHPGRILVQVAEMPDGVRYLCIGRSIVKRSGTYLVPNRHYAIGIGCELAHADKLVYSQGLSFEKPVPIGVSCRICERAHCHQRAFPPLERRFVIPEHERGVVPYVLEE
jgi:predicted transcriptional regulator/transcriptional regulator with XRE-family HTH domain